MPQRRAQMPDSGMDHLFADSWRHRPDPMTRSDLVEELAARFGQLTQRDAEAAVKTILDAVGDALVRGHRIEVRGFGSFSVNRRPPRMGRNPRSGEAVHIPEKRVPHFKPGKALREAVDRRTAEMGIGIAADPSDAA
ncbi:integration host factor subunit beta [Paracidovorax citrulli]|nr:integration host factor subunit beta [Paracidovorax citrulli]QCX12429.1 Integration host factor subunit beta [Paracidovorax citrulli]REG67744.1 integration host factor subunit beta [Paracidovorax citrulli]RLJ92304.1 integration host factor subunit beta [Paracidovorax citrulli]SDK91678.1 integration host factor subunit beta [Paracidovorax citrulli]